MAEDEDADDDARPVGPPLPPDDRLWRHPSELRAQGAAASVAPAPARSATPRGPAASWPLLAATAAGGAALAVGVVMLTGAMPRRVVERPVIEKVAVTPMVSTPMLAERSLGAVVEQLGPALVRLEVERADGSTSVSSGLVFRDDGAVLTSWEAVSGARVVEAVLADGRRLEGDLLGADPLTDVAVLDVDAEHLPVAALGTGTELSVGGVAVTLGAPDAGAAGPTAAAGMITALDRWLQLDSGVTLHGLIQTDGEPAPHLAGGPLVDANGAVIGITTRRASGEDEATFAVPVALAHEVADRILTQGHMVHAWLGVEGTDLSVAQQRSLALAGGAVVHRVVDGSPAAAAGLQPGDVITDLGDHEVRSISGLIVALRTCDPGDPVPIGYLRGPARHRATVVIGERPTG